MASYDLTQPCDRKHFRQDRVNELAAIRDGAWPRDVNDDMRWIHAHGDIEQRRAYAARMCQSAIDYVDDLERRIAAKDPDVASFQGPENV